MTTETQPIITAVPLPRGSLIEQALARIDYADAYRAQVRSANPPELDALVRAVFVAAPGWVRLLLRLRDALVRPFGLKPASSRARSASALQPGAALGLFRVLARGDDEIVLGDDDRHLDFRVGVLRQVDGDRVAVTVSTIVCFHGWLGRLYFLPVRSFHRMLVPALMRRAAARLF